MLGLEHELPAGLPQPGGPAVEAEAAAGDPRAIPLPRPLLDRPGCDMSFSGLKTAVLRVRDQAVAAEGVTPRVTATVMSEPGVGARWLSVEDDDGVVLATYDAPGYETREQPNVSDPADEDRPFYS